MTNEQWLVYLWSVYPNGEFIQIWITLLIVFIIGMIPVAINHFDGYEDETTLWSKPDLLNMSEHLVTLWYQQLWVFQFMFIILVIADVFYFLIKDMK